MVESLSTERFLELSHTAPILDVRAPAEFAKARIPKAYNLPLFTNEERAVIGTAYKQQGREAAILLGLDAVGGKMRHLVEEATRIVQENSSAEQRTVLVHCWRGGMRSSSVAWLLDLVGFKVFTLRGGYKAFRNFALATFAKKYEITILGGYTGSRKTQILRALREHGEQVLDLEALAHHKGSTFGAIGEAPAPSTEHFENLIATCLHNFDPTRRIWIEDESRTVGRCSIPERLWEQMRTTTTLFLDIPFSERVQHLCDLYGDYPVEELRASIERVAKRLGGVATRTALAALDDGDIATTASSTLAYYDKTYLRGLQKRDMTQVQRLAFENASVETIAEALLLSLPCARASQKSQTLAPE
jgi:tRNA 2-selenouridine synthase